MKREELVHRPRKTRCRRGWLRSEVAAGRRDHYASQQRLLRLVPTVESDEDRGPECPSPRADTAAATKDPDDDVLDMSAFTQLLDAAQRSGLVPNADVIAYTRDREFRRKQYQKAFQVIEGLFGKFTAASIQRQQRLRREETEIASGKIRISPKKLLEKRARDTAESQRVDRAHSKFLRVLEGLRVLMRT